MAKQISVIIPVFNEGANVDAIYQRVRQVFAKDLPGYEYEVIYSDNASTDDSYDRIRALAQVDERVRGIRLSRNFGFQANILSGLMNASGDAVVQLDADGEDPPEMIPILVQKWVEGYEVVFGIRKVRQEGWLLTALRKIFYRVLHRIADIKVPIDAGDFRLIDRRVADLIRGRFGEYNPYLRGLISYAGFRQIGIPYERMARISGESKFTLGAYLRLALDAATSFSRFPLKLVSVVGLILSLFSFLGIMFYLVAYTLGAIPVKGFTTLLLLLLLVSGIQLLSLGLLGEYIGRIFDEVKRRPRLIIADAVGFKKELKDA